MRRVAFGLLFAWWVNASMVADAGAQETGVRSYAVMSLIGDSLSVVPFNGALAVRSSLTGTRIDPQVHLSLTFSSGGFDDISLNTIAASARQTLPDVAVDLLQTRNASLFKLQDRVFDTNDAAKDAREALKATLKERNASYLILLTKHRSDKAEMVADAHLLSDANLRLLRGSTGDYTRTEGLGFYVDDAIRVQNLKTLDIAQGVLVGYLDATLWLIDARTLAVIRELPVAKSVVVAVSKPLEVGFNAWDEATEQQKVQALRELIVAALKETTPKLVGAPR
jgi:hypothetical protein